MNTESSQKHRDCRDCIYVSTPKGKSCYTMIRRLDELIRSKGLPFYPAHVIPALDEIADTCPRYKEQK